MLDKLAGNLVVFLEKYQGSLHTSIFICDYLGLVVESESDGAVGITNSDANGAPLAWLYRHCHIQNIGGAGQNIGSHSDWKMYVAPRLRMKRMYFYQKYLKLDWQR